MKKVVPFLVVLPMLLLLTGCPYNSKVPLSNTPKVAVDANLLGTWQTVNDKDSIDMKIFSFNSLEYYIDVRPTLKNSSEISRYRTFVSMVGKEKIVNMEDLDKKGEYNFFSYKLEGDLLRVQLVSDVSVKEVYLTSKKMNKAFSKKIGEKDFYESEMKFVRKK